MHRLEDYCGTPIINGTLILWHKLLGYRRGRWSGANSPIGPWSHGYESYEGGAERGYRTPSIALIA